MTNDTSMTKILAVDVAGAELGGGGGLNPSAGVPGGEAPGDEPPPALGEGAPEDGAGPPGPGASEDDGTDAGDGDGTDGVGAAGAGAGVAGAGAGVGGAGVAEGDGVGLVLGAGAALGGGVVELADVTLMANFCPREQCWPKVQMKYVGPGTVRLMLAGPIVTREMGLLEMHPS